MNTKRKTSEMTSSSEEELPCKPRCKLHSAAFEEAFVEDVRRQRCLYHPSRRGFNDNQVKNNAFEIIGLAHIQ